MPNISRLRALGPKEQALVAVAVLLDGHDAAEYFSSDRERHTALARAARDLAELVPELRLPLAATVLRGAISALEEVVHQANAVSELGAGNEREMDEFSDS